MKLKKKILLLSSTSTEAFIINLLISLKQKSQTYSLKFNISSTYQLEIPEWGQMNGRQRHAHKSIEQSLKTKTIEPCQLLNLHSVPPKQYKTHNQQYIHEWIFKILHLFWSDLKNTPTSSLKSNIILAEQVSIVNKVLFTYPFNWGLWVGSR